MKNLEATAPGFSIITAAKGEEVELAMQKLWLVGRILPVGARLIVRHTFRSAEKKPLEVIYAFGLPRDAALRRFRISGAGFSVHSELKPVAEALKIYEEGIAQGSLSSLLRQYQDGLVNLTVGNIRPGEEVKVDLEILSGVEIHDDGLRFRFPFTLAPAYHSRARTAEVRPGAGEIELPEDEFDDLILPQFASDASSLHEVGFDLTAVMPGKIVETSSPSHAIRVERPAPNRQRLSLATAKDLPDRDLVVDIRTREKSTGVLAGTDRGGKGYFAAVIPSSEFGQTAKEPRRIAFVLDRSGSMGGAPIAQARQALEACLGALAAEDKFGIIAFDDKIEAFGRGLDAATTKNRERARAFLSRIDARGGTELRSAIDAAARFFGDRAGQGGDIMVLTDGQVFGTDAILAGTRSTDLRVHCLGIGSAGRDFFLSRLAVQTGGVYRSVTARERVDLTAMGLFAAIGRPLASDLTVEVEGFAESVLAPEPQKLVHDGDPLVVFGETSGPGQGRLRLEWTTGGAKKNLSLSLSISPVSLRATAGSAEIQSVDGETLRLLQGSRLIVELEGSLFEEGAGKLERRRQSRVEARLARLSEAYGLASRFMALVAVVKRQGDKPGDLPVTRVVPVGLPQDVEFGAYFGVSALAMAAPGAMVLGKMAFKEARLAPDVYEVLAKRPIVPPVPDSGSELMALAAQIEPDGGMPGKTKEERILATILALLRFLADGNTIRRGIFRQHVQRLLGFLEKSPLQNDVTRAVISRVRSGKALEGDWAKRTPDISLWRDLAEALGV